jgi:transcriptional regulator with XRE-family HTH domain
VDALAVKQNDSGMPTDPRSPFGQCVRKIRNQKKFTLEKLSELTGLHATYLGEIERGIRNPALVSIVRIARGLNVTPAKLFGNGRW